ncbi:DciA family protein [Pelagibacterium sp. 26DY04]|uniref:DUF721 domain-containing protein n=1 Tax=Pelagibacterium sp. 26DY04 TaxID=2967130 RepID=UPI002814B9CE|nr:DciA family protein [Pelagibacterium sp. 26DY04]WMT87865.1 DciA family protein [Pelagibacterium sp. 26DY04]
MAGKSSPPKRKNRTVQLSDVIDGMLDPALRRRGFANRELIVNWASIVAAPWDRATLPDKLVWPRKDRPDPEGAVLYLRCLESHKVMLPHEAPAIAMAINRYFGYLLIRSVRLSLNPLSLPQAPAGPARRELSAQAKGRITEQTRDIEDPELRAALEKLGRGILGKGKH